MDRSQTAVMTAQSALLALSFVVLALLISQLRWVLLVLFGAVVVAVALDVLIDQLQNRSRLVAPSPGGGPGCAAAGGACDRAVAVAGIDHPDSAARQ